MGKIGRLGHVRSASVAAHEQSCTSSPLLPVSGHSGSPGGAHSSAGMCLCGIGSIVVPPELSASAGLLWPTK